MNTSRNAIREARSALEFWQALEYLAPQKPPKVEPENCVWSLDASTPEPELPWRDTVKLALLRKTYRKWRFQIFSGIVDGHALVDEARDALGATALDDDERSPPAPAACLVIEADDAGMATGQVFVSTVPWAMSRIVRHAGQTSPIDFTGFFGPGGLDEEIRNKARELLVTRKLLGTTAVSASPARESEPAAAQVKHGHEDEHQDEDEDEDDHDATAVQERVEAKPLAHAATDPDLRPLSADDIDAVTALAFAMCGWTPGKQLAWRIKAIPVPEKEGNEKKSQDDPLNSFFAEDLERIGAALARDDIGDALGAYLQGEASPGRVDLERHPTTLIEGVHPYRWPHGCWPAEHPLVLAQQFAVNTLMQELRANAGIFSVNGPPGTGKTTMLKDIVAAVVTHRADLLVTFKSPLSAFEKKLEIDNYAYGTAYVLDERLCGSGIVVASANNGAVENVTKELPGLDAIGGDVDLDYFASVADSLAAAPNAKRRAPQAACWGLASAVLGNKGNRSQFASRFWFADWPRKQDTTEPPPAPDPLRLRSLPSIIAQGDHGALPWDLACARYVAAKGKVQALAELAAEGAGAIERLQDAHHRIHAIRQRLDMLAERLPGLDSAAATQEQARAEAEARLVHVSTQLDALQALRQAEGELEHAAYALADKKARLPEGGPAMAAALHDQALALRKELEQRRERHMDQRPGLLSELLRLPSSKRWNAMGLQLDADWDQARRQEQDARERLDLANTVVHALPALQARVAAAERKRAQAADAVDAARIDPGATRATLTQACHASKQLLVACNAAVHVAHDAANAARSEIRADQDALVAAEEEADFHRSRITALALSDAELATWRLAELDRDHRHAATPYRMAALFQARRELFVAAMALHKSFIVAAWSRLRPTLHAFVSLLIGGIHPGQVAQGVNCLWDAFFMVVPVVSTAFASFPRLFAGVGREQLGWLLIDEAGQAAPQQAVGAIWRARRAVVVGDPLQLEPVVAVPQEIVAALLLRCRTEKQWAPPQASAQVLADRANRYGTYLREPGSDEKLWLGSPLVVHRRCLDPMFGIANRIAYQDMMVYGTAADKGPDGIGPSCWHDIPAEGAQGHWIEAQGQLALRLAVEIIGPRLPAGGAHQVYVITPFRKVAEKIGALLEKQFGPRASSMSGTVHTFQGKEAEHVIFLLGGDPRSPGVISTFAGAKPNLVNVAVTRAKRRLYVIGDRRYWTSGADTRGIYTTLAERLPVMSTGA